MLIYICCDLQVPLCGPKLFVVFTTVHKRRKRWSADTLTWLPLMLFHQAQFILQRYFKVCISLQYWQMLFVITCKFLDVHNWCRCLTFATLKDEDGNPLETEYGLSTYKDHQTFTIQVKCWSLWFAQMASLLVHFLQWHSTLLLLAGNARKSPCRTAASFSRHHFW